MAISKEQYQKALDIMHEHLPMQLQRQDRKTGEWKNIGSCVRGHEAAYAELNSIKEKTPKAVLRVLPKNEADKYREGLSLGRKLGPESEEQSGSKRKHQMYLPEHM